MAQRQKNTVQTNGKFFSATRRYAGWVRSLIRHVTQHFTIATTPEVYRHGGIISHSSSSKELPPQFLLSPPCTLCSEHSYSSGTVALCGSSCRSPVFCVILAEDTLSSGQGSFVKNTEADEGKAGSRWWMSMLPFIGSEQLPHIEKLGANWTNCSNTIVLHVTPNIKQRAYDTSLDRCCCFSVMLPICCAFLWTIRNPLILLRMKEKTD